MVLGSSSGRTQQNACAVLQEVCRCGSGEQGCDKATSEEISVLLDTLQAPAQSVRDAALRVRLLLPALVILLCKLITISHSYHSFIMYSELRLTHLGFVTFFWSIIQFVYAILMVRLIYLGFVSLYESVNHVIP